MGDEIKLLNITKGVFYTYRNEVKNNNNDRWYMCRKKLTRNWMLADYIKSDDNVEWRNYGCLHMCLDKNSNKIIWIENLKGEISSFSVDIEKKKELEKILHIKKYRKNKNMIKG